VSLQHTCDREGNAIPALPILFELLSARGRQLVVLRVTIVLARAPLGLELAVLLQGIERREERARIDLKTVVTERRESLRDPITVHGFSREDREDHEIQRALRNVQSSHSPLL